MMSKKFPIGFIGHGSPMNIVSENSYTKSIYNMGEKLPKPKAIMVITAHWLTDGYTYVSCSENPDLIYDFYGFPEELYKIQYNCSGYPKIEHLLRDTGIVCNNNVGLDHGVWSILKHMYPRADIPVVALSIDMSKPVEYHFQLGEKIKHLRENDVLVLGSGNVVHNLFKADVSNMESEPYDWAVEFDKEVVQCLKDRRFSNLIDYGKERSMSIPTKDHYLPLLYILGMAEENDDLEIIYEGIQNKSISMLSFLFK